MHLLLVILIVECVCLSLFSLVLKCLSSVVNLVHKITNNFIKRRACDVFANSIHSRAIDEIRIQITNVL
jgi:hypothetical protein